MDRNEINDISTQRFELQKALFEKGFDQVQSQINHLDDILFKIKASAITVWVAVMGWAFTSSKSPLVLLGIVVVIGFWLLESIFKGVQVRYIEISAKLMETVNDTNTLEKQFESQNFKNGIIHPLALNLKETDRIILMFRGFISPTTATVYLFLGFVNSLIWMMK